MSAADLGMEMERDAGQAIALLRSRDSSGALDDVIEMFSCLGQKVKRLVQIATCRHSDDSISDRREPLSRERPPRPPPTGTRGRGATLDQVVHTTGPHPDIAGTSSWPEQSQPRTPAAATTGPSFVHEVNISTPVLQPTIPVGGFAAYNPLGGFAGYNLAPVPPPFKARHAASGSSQTVSEEPLQDEMDLSQFFSYPQTTQATQEFTEDAKVVPFGPAAQRREIRPRERFSPADYERPRAPASARRPKRARGVRGQPGAGP
ncbi:unnamed protein product [Urochloa humidicola]